MDRSLFSPMWYRVAQLKPRLAGHVRVRRHQYRGRTWYVLHDPVSGRFHRFNSTAYLLIGLMDGTHCLEDIWQAACDKLGDDLPTQDEVLLLLAQLHRADLLRVAVRPDMRELLNRFLLIRQRQRRAALRSPFAIRIPLFDPDRFLDFTDGIGKWLFSPLAAVAWMMTVGVALILAAMNWPVLTANLADRVFSLENLTIIWLVYPVIKGLHELGHAWAIKRQGGEVHEIGIMFLVFIPVPYVEGSSAAAFERKADRMLVGGAGILVELLLAAVAMFIWYTVPAGALHAVCFNIMLIAGVSTVLFNGNPLLRFDAYYILADWLELPNLYGDSRRYIGYWTRRYLFGLDAASPATTLSEALWFGVYGVAAFIYRIFITLKIALFVAGKFFTVGVLLAFWALGANIVLPLVKATGRLFSDPAIKACRGRVWLSVAFLMLTGGLLLFKLPLAHTTIAQGVVWSPEESRVFARADGFVTQVMAVPGQTVARGDVLLVCANDTLVFEKRTLQARLTEFKARYTAARLEDRTQAKILQDELARLQAQMARVGQLLDDLTVRSHRDGVFLLPDAADLVGVFVRRGTPLGLVVDQTRPALRAVVTQDEIDRIRRRVETVRVRFAGALHDPMDARIVKEVPAATRLLPSMALSLEGGGPFALDPQAAGEPRVLENLFVVELNLIRQRPSRIGERVYVRFEHPAQPLVPQYYQQIRRLLLRRFNL